MSGPDGGRIGRQETAFLLGIPLYINAVFTLESGYAYAKGNSSYIWVPLAVLLSLGLFLLVAAAMGRAGAGSLGQLYEMGLGRTGGRALMAALAALLLVTGVVAVMRFISMLYSYVYIQSAHSSITLWVVGTVLVLALWGIETISRLSKLLGCILIAVVLVSLLAPMESYQTYRLYPMPGNTPGEIALYTLRHTFVLLPALLAGLCITQTEHGLKFMRVSGCVGACTAALLAFFTQLAVSLTYDYKELTAMYSPLYRLDMAMLREGYFFRLDKVALFLWLVGELIAAAFFLFSAARIASRELGLKNTRPAVAAFTALLGCLLFFEHGGGYEQVEAAEEWLNLNGCLFLPPFLLVAGLGALRGAAKRKKEANHETA